MGINIRHYEDIYCDLCNKYISNRNGNNHHKCYKCGKIICNDCYGGELDGHIMKPICIECKDE
jgi:hypothetical protein